MASLLIEPSKGPQHHFLYQASVGSAGCPVAELKATLQHIPGFHRGISTVFASKAKQVKLFFREAVSKGRD